MFEMAKKCGLVFPHKHQHFTERDTLSLHVLFYSLAQVLGRLYSTTQMLSHFS